jgi:multidrug resistance efflux pump
MDYMSPDELEEELNRLRQEAQEIDRQLAEEDDESNLSGLKEKKNMKASQVKELKAELKQAKNDGGRDGITSFFS